MQNMLCVQSLHGNIPEPAEEGEEIEKLCNELRLNKRELHH